MKLMYREQEKEEEERKEGTRHKRWHRLLYAFTYKIESNLEQLDRRHRHSICDNPQAIDAQLGHPFAKQSKDTIVGRYPLQMKKCCIKAY